MATDKPELVSPLAGAAFWYDDSIEFKWRLADMVTIKAKLDLYIGLDPVKPWEALTASRSWDLRPQSYWSSFDTYPVKLGLERHRTYYWMIAQEKPGHGMTLLSEVRALHIHGQRFPAKLVLGFGSAPPKTVKPGVAVNFAVGIRNESDGPIRLFFSTPQHFDVRVYQQRGILSDKFVWSPPRGHAMVTDTLDIQPKSQAVETFSWPQIDSRGDSVLLGFDYRIVVRCLADDFHEQAQETCGITYY
jgi:hypothetical protein